MRLLNVKTGQLEEFSAANVPRYAILSHTWGDDEVTFLDLFQAQTAHLTSRLNLFGSSSPEAKPSYNKIRHARKQAENDGYGYLWADTACIDKSSSAELSEAINSMFRWYAHAEICYAYLEDAPEGFPHKQVDDAEIDLTDMRGRQFVSCRWFTRGWTLQELLAPRQVTFYGGKDWRRLGTKSELADWVVLATGVDRETLLDPSQLRKISVARRMSWASNRVTTRTEDVAYCLLGIFGVNMPLLYGEGENAFIRLQEEIMKYSDDQSLFAWKALSERSLAKAYGIFARSPKLFEDSGKVIPISSQKLTSPFTMTNRGLQIDLALIPLDPDHLPETGGKEYLGLLDCQYEDDFSTCLAITLKATHTSRVLVRLEGEERSLQKVTPQDAAKAVMQTLFIPREFIPMKRSYVNCQVQCSSLEEQGYALIRAKRPADRNRSRWNPETQILRIEAADEDGSLEFIPHATFIFYNRQTHTGFAVRLDMRDDDVDSSVKLSRLRGKTLDFVLMSFATIENDVLLQYNAQVAQEKMDSLILEIEPRLANSPKSRQMGSTRTRGSPRFEAHVNELLENGRQKHPVTAKSWNVQSLIQDTARHFEIQDILNGPTEELQAQKHWIKALRNEMTVRCSKVLNKVVHLDGLTNEDLVSLDLETPLSKPLPISPTAPTENTESVFIPLTGRNDFLYDTVRQMPSYAEFKERWHQILELDAANSTLGSSLEHQQDMDDGSQMSFTISAKLDRQNIFDQKLHILTVEMNYARAFEIG